MSFFDQPARVTRFKLVHAVWRRQRMELLPGVAPVSLLLARTDNTVVGLTDVRGYASGFVFLLRVRWGHVPPGFRSLWAHGCDRCADVAGQRGGVVGSGLHGPRSVVTRLAPNDFC